MTSLTHDVTKEEEDGTVKDITLNVTVKGKDEKLEVDWASYKLVTTEAHIALNKAVVDEPENGEA